MTGGFECQEFSELLYIFATKMLSPSSDMFFFVIFKEGHQAWANTAKAKALFQSTVT
jgi:hypothetical protein